MSLENRLEALQRRHRELHEKIEKLEDSPSVDDIEIQALKREKLSLKDSIAMLQTQTR